MLSNKSTNNPKTLKTDDIEYKTDEKTLPKNNNKNKT